MTGPNSDLLTLLTFWARSSRALVALRGDATWRTRARSELRLIVIPDLLSFRSMLDDVEKLFL